MNEMQERVAKAIDDAPKYFVYFSKSSMRYSVFVSTEDDVEYGSDMTMGEADERAAELNRMSRARAAMEAMRVMTPEMEIAGWQKVKRALVDGKNGALQALYGAMIDAARQEQATGDVVGTVDPP